MISVVIITHNEEENIRRCLTAVKEVADEIIVVDSYSNDDTEQICNEFNVNFFKKEWEGYSAAKNYGNSLAKYDYILSIDADEVLSEKLINSITEIKANLNGVYKFNRLTNYAGHWVRHCGWYPDDKVRLFPKHKAQWIGDYVHETLKINPEMSVFHLKGDLLHYSYKSREDHLSRIQKYSELHAQRMFSENKKSSVIRLYLSPVFKFIKDYFFQLGILDGKTGLTICLLSAYAVFLKYKKHRNLNNTSN